MAGKAPTTERVASVLATAAMFGDKKAAKEFGCTVQTIRNYRRRADADAEILADLARKKDALVSRWADGLAPAITGCIDFIRRAHEVANPADPETIKAINGSLKILSDVATAERVLDARFAPQARAAGETARQVGEAVHVDQRH